MRVLIVDDEPSIRKTTGLAVEMMGHEVVAAVKSGEEAVDACREHHPDVLVVDEKMPPGINGVEVARQVRAADPSIQVVIFTNFDEEEIIKGAANAGAVFVLKGNLRALRAALTLG